MHHDASVGHETSSLLTVVLADTAGSVQLERALRQVVRTEPRSGAVNIVVATPSLPSLSGSLRRRVRRIPLPARDVRESLLVEATSWTGPTLVAPSSTVFFTGWVEAAIAQAAAHPDVIGVTTSDEQGAILLPPGTKADAPRVSWDTVHRDTSLSAVMIVKDESAVLAKCLESVRPFVDEIIVYDTGSSDDTTAIARAAGAVVVEGFWDDDFGAARNRALEHATSAWVLQVDADEVLTGDPAALRARLAEESHDMVQTPLLSTAYEGATTGAETFPFRLFRREQCEWHGALHEAPGPRPGAARFLGASTVHAPVTFIHSGYHHDALVQRGKQTRNRELAEVRFASTALGDPGRADAVADFGRALMWEGRLAQGVDVLKELKFLTGNAGAVVMAVRAAADYYLATGRTHDLEDWIDALARHHEAPGSVEYLRGRQMLARGDVDGASATCAWLRTHDGGADPWNSPYDTAKTTLLEALVHLARGDAATAVMLLTTAVAVSPETVPVQLLISTAVQAGTDLLDIARAVPDSYIAPSLRAVASLAPSTGLTWCDALASARPGDERPLAAGTVLASRTTWQIALTWSLRAREHGHAGPCALERLAGHQEVSAFDRTIACALLGGLLGVSDAWTSFSDTVAALGDDELQLVAHLLTELGISVPMPDITPQLPAEEMATC